MLKKRLLQLLLCTSIISLAQNSGELRGRVIDNQSLLPLEGATVIIDGSTMGVVTDAEGYFIFNDVPPRT